VGYDLNSVRVAVVLRSLERAEDPEALLWGIHRSLCEYDYRILVVDDGTGDRTDGIVRNISSRVPIRIVSCRGASDCQHVLRAVLFEVRGLADVVVTLNAAEPHDPTRIPLLIEAVACGPDVVVASRFTASNRIYGVSRRRALQYRAAAAVFRRRTGIRGVRDYTCGFRAYRRDLVEQLCIQAERKRFVSGTGQEADVELLVRAGAAGASLAELPHPEAADPPASASSPPPMTLSESLELLNRIRAQAAASVDVPARRYRPQDLGLQAEAAALTVASDIVAVLASFLLSFLAYRAIVSLGILDRGEPEALRYAALALLFAATTVTIFWRFGLYRTRLSALHLRHLEIVVQALVVSMAFFFAILFFATTRSPSRLLVLGALFLSLPVVTLTRRLVSGWLRQRQILKGRSDRILIYGVGGTGRLLAKKLMQAPRLGAEVVGFLDDRVSRGTVARFRVSQIGAREITAPVLGGISDLAAVATETAATELCIAIPELPANRIEDLRSQTSALGLRLGIVPRMGAVRPDQLVVEDLGALPVLRFETGQSSRASELAKRAVDIFVVLLLTPLLLPLGILTGIAVRLDGKPVLFRQTRIGKDGRLFTLFKFRTMYPRSAAYAASPTNEADPRLTTIGRFVRLAGLDELPQLINILRGEMSIVGPRPEMPQVVARYGDVERSRLRVRPGLTGLWQISPDRSAAIHENLEYDLYYLSRQNLVLDLLVLGETLLFAVRALGRSLLRAKPESRRKTASQLRDLPGRTAGDQHAVRPRNGSVVFLALDQRRRDGEPVSWDRYIPRVPELADHFAVKILAARPNQMRISELVPATERSNGTEALDYVPYEPDSIRETVSGAACVVTEMRHIADWASTAGVPTFLIDDGQFRLDAGPNGEDGSLVEVVTTILGGGIAVPRALA
jgi:exopolysaccharide biosynthesis polyprenyl glycosylphosphotransferase